MRSTSFSRSRVVPVSRARARGTWRWHDDKGALLFAEPPPPIQTAWRRQSACSSKVAAADDVGCGRSCSAITTCNQDDKAARFAPHWRCGHAAAADEPTAAGCARGGDSLDKVSSCR
ncbi:hypothetical protein MTO96_013615 [Rhipicephalus appendiculatus]